MLNSDQHMVVESQEHTMVVACAGSGKTETSSRYTEARLNESITSVVMMLTFTDAAAKGMANRLDKNLDRSIRSRALSSTFHSCALKLYRERHPDKRLVMSWGQQLIIERAMREVSSKRLSLDSALQTIDKIGRILKPKKSNYPKAQWALYERYCELRDAEGKVDFNQISREVVLGMQNNSWKSLVELDGITHLVADEFQDCDELQLAFLLEHARRGVVVMVVGDDDQSIYQFRGSKGFDNFVNFQQALNADAIALRICYRCRPQVLETADRLIQFNHDRIEKELISNFESGGAVTVNGYGDNDEQIDAIVQDICREPMGVAVLSRTNKELDNIELMLNSHNIKTIRIGGKSLWENINAVAYIKALVVGYHPKGAQYLVSLLSYLRCSEEQINHVKTQLHQRLAATDIFQYLVTELSGSQSSLFKLFLNHHIERTHEKKNNCDWQKPLIHHLVNARNLKSNAVASLIADILTQRAYRTGSLLSAIEELANSVLFNPRKKDLVINKKDVVLSTLHGSKGLEFKRVHIMNVVENKIPAEDVDGLGIAHIEEERRLFYVGITRAEETCNMHFVNKPSFFLKEAALELTQSAVMKLAQQTRRTSVQISNVRATLHRD
ncbi:UvrD-helicase domain-containing protein [Vibrio owensii]|uniref:UvrD-helicase domain-containing protein n=1 Tax=Vibrio owensii TaxID=696485 RepID=UPI004067E66D